MDWKLGGLIVAIALLGGCDAYATRGVEKQVRAALKDPESAKFSGITVAGNGTVACGLVNARNSFGGYVGDRPFMVFGEQVVIDIDAPESTLQACCETMKQAVAQHKGSDEIPQFAEQCGRYLERFHWGK